ncbi:MAG: hypothetical protein V4608_09790 [Bacteroidota bacterium]
MKNLFMLVVVGWMQLFVTFAQKSELGLEQAQIKGEEYINKILMSNIGGKVKVKSISEEDCLYKLIIETNGQEYISYMSKDGKKFFQTGRDIDMEMKRYIDERTTVKLVKPKVELFVMSYCPYGIQMEKGILPVLETLGNKIDFELKFCSYAMHDQKELTEQLREFCIQKQYPELFINYLSCFLEEGNSAKCLVKSGIDTIKLNSYIAATDKEYHVMEQFKDNSTWYMNKYPSFNIYKEDNIKYNLKGSPNLIINGKKMPSGRDPQSLMELISSAFIEPPAECKTKLSSANPSPGFGSANAAPGPNQECNGSK